MKNYQVFTVGGAVRDKLMGRDPKDYDYVVVGSTPQQMIDMGFLQVGADFPVFLNQRNEEFALARRERKTGEGYLGFTTETDDVTLEEDLSRRDLTINAMAMDEHGAIIDPFNGREDLNRQVLRHVSPAFAEDPLRVIRLARFYARYESFTVATATETLCAEIVDRGDLNQLPVERFWAELDKVFSEYAADRFFSFLTRIAADVNVEFFNSLYGELPKKLNRVIMYAKGTRKIADPVLRVMCHVALCGLPGAVLNTADSRTKELHKNVQTLRQLTQSRVSVDGIFNLLKRAKAWSDGSQIDDMVMTMDVAAFALERFALTPSDLLGAQHVTKAVTSAMYIDEYGPGKALGAAIEKGRKQAVAKLFNLHDDDVLSANDASSDL